MQFYAVHNFIIYLSITSLLLNNYGTAAKVNTETLSKAFTDVEVLIDAYDRSDYVLVCIKLIDIILKIDPPELDSIRLIQILVLRRFLIRLYPNYLYLNPDKRPVPPTQKINIISSDTKEIINEAVNTVDIISKGTSIGLDAIFKIGKGVLNSLSDSLNEPATSKLVTYRTRTTVNSLILSTSPLTTETVVEEEEENTSMDNKLTTTTESVRSLMT